MTPEEDDEDGQRVADEMKQTDESTAKAEDVEEGSVEAPAADAAGAEGDTERVSELEAELLSTKERLLRVAADFENYRKRSKREQEDARTRGREEILREILGVFDNLKRAIDAAGVHAKDEAATAIVDGVSMVQKQFADGLSRFGLEQFSALGKPFDPNFHEAMAQQHSDEYPPGVVMVEYQSGYMLGERLMRAAMVIVSSASSTGKSGPVDETEETAEPETEIETDGLGDEAAEEEGSA